VAQTSPVLCSEALGVRHSPRWWPCGRAPKLDMTSGRSEGRSQRLRRARVRGAKRLWQVGRQAGDGESGAVAWRQVENGDD